MLGDIYIYLIIKCSVAAASCFLKENFQMFMTISQCCGARAGAGAIATRSRIIFRAGARAGAPAKCIKFFILHNISEGKTVGAEADNFAFPEPYPEPNQNDASPK
jgi:hypothetical protein